ncbi:uncharacterized protein [Venturia canescens]|uniref:uncharacterized protein n=1 Tax=Venturia canescens TaxID=32260 RepID=UPI001C9BF5B6|nr:uncharacterized protein LOC122417946 [Venturia canescens]
MSSVSKCRRVKRPTILAKRSALAKKSFYNKRSYKPLYEKVKGNNNALAKSLSKEKQENQYLFTENLALKSQTQELTLALNRRDDIITGVLKNAKDTLGLLVTATNYLTNTIASCQQVINTPKFTPRKSTSRDSNRRLSDKSPARGVVQPMVGGHTITKPTINLSRLNMQREYRDRNRPNLSDIEESATTPEQSPVSQRSVGQRSASPGQVPIHRALNCDTRRVNRMPERLRRTLRTSDESPRRSSGRGLRNSSGRRSIRRSREVSGVSSPHINNDESLRSPRVSLHDVSRLLHNAQSVNIRTLLEASNEMELSNSGVSAESLPTEKHHGSPSEANPPGLFETPPPSSALKAKSDSSARRDAEDPLEGPSWLLDDSEVARPLTSAANKTAASASANETRLMNDSFEETDTVSSAGTLPYRYSSDYRDWNEDDMRTDSNLPIFVTRKRGSRCDDTDDFTLMFRKPAPKNYNFDLNDLELPVIESPIVKASVSRVPEPELTANIQTVQTQNFANLTSLCRPTVDPDEETMYLHPMEPPLLSDNSDISLSTVVAQNERSDDDDGGDSSRFVGHRKRPQKKTHSPVIDSLSESEHSPSPKRNKSKTKRKLKTKDPSSAKVVLLKLKDNRFGKSTVSPETRTSEDYRNVEHSATNPDPSSDSEMSNASSTKLAAASAGVQARPRRQKAPKNLQEPSLGKKLRRH